MKRSTGGVGPGGTVIYMSEKETPDETKDDNEDWMSYANAGFGTTDYSLWDDEAEAALVMDEPDFDDTQLVTGEEEIPAAPRPAG
ncbi:MAG TPA: hypothetical protein EYG33_08865, partial [Candidatus Poseidoniales archaeon]|nr:hypothetical protein [Candidatus Poseidoniales archaeon]